MPGEKMLAYHFDMKRAMYRREYMDRLVDRLKGWGFDHIVYEIEDKFRWRNHPTISHADAPENAETADFVAACRAKGVDVIPLMQSLGHAECILGKPEYAHLRELPDRNDLFDATSDESRRLILELFDEIIAVFQPRAFFHMGGDETRGLGTSEKAKPFVEKMGVGGLYLHHMRPIFERLHGRGLRPIIWADIVLAHPEVLDAIPRYVTMLDWDYFTGAERVPQILVWGGRDLGHSIRVTWPEFQEAAKGPKAALFAAVRQHAVDDQTRRDGTFRGFYCTDLLRAAGFEVLTGSASRCSGDMVGVPLHERHIPNVFHFARKGFASGMGHLVTSWAVRHNHPEVGLPAVYAAPFALRAEDPLDLDALGRAFTKDFYGVEMPEFIGAVMKAQPTFGSLCQAAPLHDVRRAVERGENPLPKHLEFSDQRFGGREAAVRGISDHLAGYQEARDVFRALQGRAARNAENFDFWIEGVDLDIFYADFMLAALKDTLRERARPLLTRIKPMRETTRALFRRTYPERSTEEELAARYGFHEAYLRGLTAAAPGGKS